MSDVERDPTRTEDVEEALGRREENRRLWLAQKALRWAADKISGDTPRGDGAEEDLRWSAEMLEPMIEDGWKETSNTAPGRIAATDDLRDLRSRLEKVEEERRKWEDACRHNMNVARDRGRRSEALEGAVRTVLNEHRMAEDWSLPKRLEEYLLGVMADIDEPEPQGGELADRLRSALDSREDEGAKDTTGPVDEHPRMRHRYGHDMTYETTERGYGRCSCGARENTDAAVERCPHNPMSEPMPVHADEPEGDEGRMKRLALYYERRFDRLWRWKRRASSLLGKLLEDIQGGRTDSVVDCPCSRVAGRQDEIAELLSEPTDEPVSREGETVIIACSSGAHGAVSTRWRGEVECDNCEMKPEDDTTWRQTRSRYLERHHSAEPPSAPTHADARSEGDWSEVVDVLEEAQVALEGCECPDPDGGTPHAQTEHARTRVNDLLSRLSDRHEDEGSDE